MFRKRFFTLLLPLLTISGCTSPGEAQSTDGNVTLLDVHGAGAQRSDPKTGDPADYPTGNGPQGDVVRIYNAARAVRLVSNNTKTYPIVDTNQTTSFTASSGEDADYTGLTPDYTENGNGTVTDNNTGLTWQQDTTNKMGESDVTAALAAFQGTGGYNDWRVPSIKELYSLILFSGRDISGVNGDTSSFTPFIDDSIFTFAYGDTSNGERLIDVQFFSTTEYVSTTMNGDRTVFGVNLADGRIKGYPYMMGNEEKSFNLIFVRGNSDYGINDFTDNGDGTITDNATGLMWTENDTNGLNWEEALSWAENLTTGGYADWRLPDAKELQSIVEYSRSPDTTGSAAIDPLFSVTQITDEGGGINYPFYWSSTTHANNSGGSDFAVYVSFGEALGYMSFSLDRGLSGRPLPSQGRLRLRRPEDIS